MSYGMHSHPIVDYQLACSRPDLTVEEHMRIFSNLKCLLKVNAEVIEDLARGVDLLKKLKAPAKSLSGGQKRKLQLVCYYLSISDGDRY